MDPSKVSLPWVEIFKLSLSAGVVTVLLNNAFSWVRDWRKESATQERHARNLALKSAVAFEAFAIDCAIKISDNQLHVDSDGYSGSFDTTLPPLLEYSKDEDWKLLDTSLSAEVLSFPNEIALSQQDINSWKDMDTDFLPSAFASEAGKFGYRALEVAKNLRKKYKIPPFRPEQFSWDIVEKLKEYHDEALRTDDKHQ